MEVGGDATVANAGDSQPTSISRQSPRRESALAGLFAFIWYFAGSWIPAYSNDESITATSVDRTFGDVLRIAPNDAALEPYYFGLNLWAHVSTSALWLRLPSVIAMALAVAFLYRLTVAIGGRRLAALVAVAMIAMPATSNYAQEIRPYAIGVAACAAAVLAWYLSLSAASRWVGFWYGLSIAIAILMHAYTALLVVALFVTVIFCYRDQLRRSMTRTLVPPAVALVLMSPYLLFVAKHARGAPSHRELGIDGILQTALITAVGRQYSALASLLSALFLLMAAAGILLCLAPSAKRMRLMAVLAATWAGVFPLGLIALQAMTGAPGLVARYWAFAIPGIALGVGLFWWWLWQRVHRFAAIATLCVVAVLCLPVQAQLRTPDGHFGQRWTLLPEVVNLPGMQPYPLVLPAWLYESTLANADGQIPTSRFPFWEDLRPEGRVYQHELDPADPRIASLATQVPGVILYTYEGATNGRPPSASAFDVPEQRALISQFPNFALSCSYFGDALGVFVKPGDPMANADQTADAIEDLSPGNIKCQVWQPEVRGSTVEN